MIKFVRYFAGCILLMFSSFGVLFGIVAILDPIGTKMADDSDPFGVPPSFTESLTLIIVYIVIFLIGVWLILGSKKIVEFFTKKLQ